ncbi:hypothetical protein BDN72DRAFT_839699 [Pluteus cervinus]|uniref:Uncharacterized protein n=1 Tax=Pluteus cervinus TaxID=181527 RepID=A0ACD3AY90_9AGAR|nr:hypothetical protein BDN72DRAFT_839699 [Pluteus cervinus]
MLALTTATKTLRRRMNDAFTKSLGIIPSPSGRDYNQIVSSPPTVSVNGQRRSSFSVLSRFFSRAPNSGSSTVAGNTSNIRYDSSHDRTSTPTSTPVSHNRIKFATWAEHFDFDAHMATQSQARDPQSQSARAGVDTKKESALDRLQKDAGGPLDSPQEPGTDRTKNPRWPVQWGDAAATEGWRSGMVEGARAIQGLQRVTGGHDGDVQDEDHVEDGHRDEEVTVGNKEGIGFVDQVGSQSATAQHFQEGGEADLNTPKTH